jgi:pimeloyl-ACP methyl ester carboxylesterase
MGGGGAEFFGRWNDNPATLPTDVFYLLKGENLSTHYEVSGSGPAIVLTHSFLCDGALFRHQVAALERTHRVINIDLRGHGRSGPSDSPFDIYDLVDDVVAVLDTEGVESAIWMGLSIGGFLSLRAALTRPERVRALVLMDSDAGPESAWKKLKYATMKWGLRTVGLRFIVPAVMPIMFGETTLRSRPELREEYFRRFLQLHVRSMSNGIDAITGRDDLLGRLKEITCPALVVVGEEDRALPVWKSRRLAAGIRGAELVVIPAAGHLSAVEQPEAVTDAIARFLARLPS